MRRPFEKSSHYVHLFFLRVLNLLFSTDRQFCGLVMCSLGMNLIHAIKCGYWYFSFIFGLSKLRCF